MKDEQKKSFPNTLNNKPLTSIQQNKNSYTNNYSNPSLTTSEEPERRNVQMKRQSSKVLQTIKNQNGYEGYKMQFFGKVLSPKNIKHKQFVQNSGILGESEFIQPLLLSSRYNPSQNIINIEKLYTYLEVLKQQYCCLKSYVAKQHKEYMEMLLKLPQLRDNRVKSTLSWTSQQSPCFKRIDQKELHTFRQSNTFQSQFLFQNNNEIIYPTLSKQNYSQTQNPHSSEHTNILKLLKQQNEQLKHQILLMSQENEKLNQIIFDLQQKTVQIDLKIFQSVEDKLEASKRKAAKIYIDRIQQLESKIDELSEELVKKEMKSLKIIEELRKQTSQLNQRIKKKQKQLEIRECDLVQLEMQLLEKVEKYEDTRKDYEEEQKKNNCSKFKTTGNPIQYTNFIASPEVYCQQSKPIKTKSTSFHNLYSKRSQRENSPQLINTSKITYHPHPMYTGRRKNSSRRSVSQKDSKSKSKSKYREEIKDSRGDARIIRIDNKLRQLKDELGRSKLF